jgi:hypothetical protein
MNPYLAAMYNTNGAAEQLTEDMQKTANMELFCKLAADNGLDLSNMTDDQIASVYAQVFPEDLAKVAEEDEKKEEHEEKESPEKEKKEEHEAGESKEDEEKEEAKKAAAAMYVQEKQAAVEKCAEADWMGRIMAHSFTQERENIELGKYAHIIETAQAEGMTDEQIFEAVKEAAGTEVMTQIMKRKGPGVVERLKNLGSSVVEKGKDVAGGIAAKRSRAIEEGRAAAGELAGHKGALKGLSSTERAAYKAAPKREGHSVGAHLKELSSMKLKGQAAKYAPHAAVGAAAVGAEEGVRRGLKKKDDEKEAKASAEAFEEIAANHAIKVAEAAGYDVEQAHSLVNAVYTLGLAESEKIAHVQDVDTATHVRGLEYLEAAGYPVNWEEIFGS